MPALSPSSTDGTEEELLLGDSEASALVDEDSVEVLLVGVSLGDSEEVLVGVGDALDEDSVVVEVSVVVVVVSVLVLEVSVVVVSGVGVADSDAVVADSEAPWTEN